VRGERLSCWWKLGEGELAKLGKIVEANLQVAPKRLGEGLSSRLRHQTVGSDKVPVVQPPEQPQKICWQFWKTEILL
jgi:hypothetical protein